MYLILYRCEVQGIFNQFKISKIMREVTVTVKLYSFEELSERAKQVAIEEVRQSYYKYNDFAQWAIDTCFLFEPPHQELVDLFGDEYDANELIIANNRQQVYFSTGRDWYIQCHLAMVVNDHTKFLKWLGIDTTIEGLKDVWFNIYTPSSRRNSNTTIEFEDYESHHQGTIEGAKKKFDEHIRYVLRGIEENIDYRFSDEAIVEEITSNEYEFTEDGKQW